MGVSCGTQYSTRRIPALVKSKAKHKFLSIEPFIQEISEIDLTGIDWVIVGGESGNNSYLREKDEKGEDKFQVIDGKVFYNNVLDDNGNKIIEKVKIRMFLFSLSNGGKLKIIQIQMTLLLIKNIVITQKLDVN